MLALAVALFFRFYQIGQVPPGLFPDEATHALDALEVLNGQLTIYSPDEGSTGALWRYLLALYFALFGPSILSLRVFASIVGVISVGMAFLVVRELTLAPPASNNQAPAFSWREAIAPLAALLLATSYWHVDLSRTGFSAVLMLLIQDVTFFFLWRALNSGQRRWFVLFGLGLGVIVYNYLPGKLAPAVPLLFFLLQWLVTRRNALLTKHWRSLLIAGGIGLALALPFVLFAVFNFQMLMDRAAVPIEGAIVTPASPLQGVTANLAAFGLWPTHWLSGDWESFFLGPTLTLCFVIGIGLSLARFRQPAHLFLLTWWLTMLLPGALVPEGAIPHTRRAIGIATPTFALVSLGLATLASALIWLVRRLPFAPVGDVSQKTGIAPFALTIGVGLLLVVQTGVNTFQRYFIQWGQSEAAKLAFHVYDLELAELMARQSGAETVYLLPLDSAAGIINPLLDSITFTYQGQAAYDFLPDDEGTMPSRLAELTKGKELARLVRWKVTKHTGADPKRVAHYFLEKGGNWISQESYPYFDIETYELDGAPDAFAPAVLKSIEVDYEGQMTLTGYAFGNTSEAKTNEPSVTTDDFLWVELSWRKAAASSTNYQVALWVEDEAQHIVGQVDKPLLNNLWHKGTGEWAVGAEEQDYYLIKVDPATPPGVYRLKVVVYAGESDGRRLAPSVPDVGADLAALLGEVNVNPPLAAPDVEALSISHRLDLEAGDSLLLLGFDPGFAGPLRPGEKVTLSLWWQAKEGPSQNLGVVIGMGQEDQTWPLSQPQPLGGADYPTGNWPAGAVVRTLVDLRLPPNVDTGEYNLGLRLLNLDTSQPLADWLLDRIQVEGRARSFETPPITNELDANFDDQVRLLGYDLDMLQDKQALGLTLYWQAQKEMQTAYKVFVHVLDADGDIISQVDQEPQAGAAPTTGWLAGEVVVDMMEIPLPESDQMLRVALGLYDPVSGKRLSLNRTEGDAVMLKLPEISE